MALCPRARYASRMAYPLPYYLTDDAALARRLMTDYPFALLSAPGETGLLASHLPLMIEDTGEALVLHGHVAHDNPLAATFDRADALAVFSGPHAYISAADYTRPERKVPTWNFQAVHVWGTPRALPESESWESLLRLTRQMDDRWTMEQAEDAVRRMMPAIIAFAMPIDRLRIWSKISGNVAPDERANLAARLDDSPHPLDHDTARAMREDQPVLKP